MIDNSNNNAMSVKATGLPRILLVDDEPRVLRSLKAALRSQYEITVANDGQEAREILEGEEFFEAIVSDERMPRLAGHELLTWAKIHCPKSARILMTGYSDFNALQNSINEAEIYRYLTKPWNIKELKKTLDTAVIKSRSGVFDQAVKKETNHPKRAACTLAVLDSNKSNALMYQSVATKVVRNSVLVHSAQALHKVLAENSDIGVLFLDVSVGNGQSVEIVSDVHKHYPNVVIIVVTSAADGTNAIRMLNNGQIFRYLVKPVTKTKLKPMIAAAVDHYIEKYTKNLHIQDQLVDAEKENQHSSFFTYWQKITSFWTKH